MQKAKLAQDAGAVAVLIWSLQNEPQPLNAIVSDTSIKIPVFSLSFFVGKNWQCQLDAKLPVNVSVRANFSFFNATTSNVITETKGGEDDDVIFIGSHLDSVDAGPGINDDGSGSSLNLELALQLAKMGARVTNKVRFGWWGAEELGLLGSKAFVSMAKADDLKKIAIYVNFDMVASPNYFIGVYNGTEGANGSVTLMQMFQQHFKSQGLNSSITGMPLEGARSDYGPFMGVGIPTGGLFSGAEGTKSVAERTLFGGLANAPYDTCYHQRCDTTENINQQAFMQFAKAAAFVVGELAAKRDVRTFLRTGK